MGGRFMRKIVVYFDLYLVDIVNSFKIVGNN